MALAAVCVLAAAWTCAAAPAGPKECSLVGTWAGNAGDDMYWLGVHTAGSTNNKGEMLLDFVGVSNGLLNGAIRMAPGRGVWEQTSKGQYKYTWYTYGIGEFGPIYTVRVSGIAVNDGCDTINIQYIYEMFQPGAWPPQNVAPENLVYATSGVAHEYRIPVAVTTP